MDEVLNNFQTALNCEDPLKCPKPTNYENLYKNWGKETQEERRKKILENQKEQRQNNVDVFRGILEYVNGTRNGGSNIFKTKSASYRPNIYVAGFNKTSDTYDNVLMLSEWLKERPSDFDRNWLAVACPKGIRTLVVSNQGATRFYTKHGFFMMETRTGLPGGNPSDCYKRKRSFCVLDGVYVDKIKTLYVLDLLAWNSQPMTDGETEFRQFWLKSHIEDFKDVSEISNTNKVIIKLLPMVDCSTKFFDEFMMTYPHFPDNFPELDGILFYHKSTHYFAGETPLVGWLYPFMVRDVLGYDIPVHDVYEKERPKDYVSPSDFIWQFEQKMAKRNEQALKKRKGAPTTMDIEEPKMSEELEQILKPLQRDEVTFQSTPLSERIIKYEPTN